MQKAPKTFLTIPQLKNSQNETKRTLNQKLKIENLSNLTNLKHIFRSKGNDKNPIEPKKDETTPKYHKMKKSIDKKSSKRKVLSLYD